MSTATDSSSKRYEDCDSDSTQQELCTLKFGSHTYYTTTSKPTCAITGTNACKADGITNATKGITCQWCGDGTKNGTEKCDGNTTTCYKQDGTYSYGCNQWGNNCSTGKYFDYYYVNCSGSCTWSLGSLYSDNNKFNSGTPSLTACSSLGL